MGSAFILLASFTSGAVLNVTSRRLHLADDPSRFSTEIDNEYVNESIPIEPSATALVLIDVWDDSKSPSLFENEQKRLLPLLAAARALQMLIIHAPSEGTEWSEIKVLPEEILVTGTDGHTGSASRCDTWIRNSTRHIKHVLVAGYDTNKCVIDKPCGSVALSRELWTSGVRVVLVRDATRGEFGWYGNAWFGQEATTSMLELGWWLPDNAGLASILLSDLLIAAGAKANATALEPLDFPSPSAAHTVRTDFFTPPPPDSTAALVVVSCSSDYGNQGFRARVAENRQRYLEPLLAAWRKTGLSPIIHSLNGHHPDGDCAPRTGEASVTTNAEFDALIESKGLRTLYYVGYAANTDVLFGAGGMQRFYAMSRYLGQPVPDYFWVDEATIGLETAATLAGDWGKKAAMGYRQPLLRTSRSYQSNVVTVDAVLTALCAAVPKGGPLLYSLPGMHTFRSATDALEHEIAGRGSCGPPMIGQREITIALDASTAALGPAVDDRKLLSLVKSVGTPYAVFQLKMDATGALLYQTADSAGWTGTLKATRFFRAPEQPVRVTVVHQGQSVFIYRNATLVANSSRFASLDYSYALALRIGKRTDAEVWNGSLGNILIRNGSWPPQPTSGLPRAEIAALEDIYHACGGEGFQYRAGTDVVGGGAPWMVGDPCSDGWFGVKCTNDGSHVTQLFPNTRGSGNALHCVLPSSIANLVMLEHLYASNDQTPSTLHGSIPTSLGKLTQLKCLYLSHNQLSGRIPTELQRLTKLQVFLMRHNQLSGPLIDFAPLTNLRNVWFDSNEGLRGTLDALGTLPHLTFLQASAIKGIEGGVPPSLCTIACHAVGTNVTCSDALPKGCCGITTCGASPPAAPSPPPSMGECFPQ